MVQLSPSFEVCEREREREREREIMDHPSSQRLIIGESPWSEVSITSSGSSSDCEYHSPTFKCVTGSRDLASSGDRYE